MTHITDTKRTTTDIVNCMQLTTTHLNCNKVNMRDHSWYMDTPAITGIGHRVMLIMNRINSQKMEMNPVITMDTPTRMVGNGQKATFTMHGM